jgi:hypothetical protein
VNQEIFSSSPVFADMFDMPQPPATPREGSSAETPLKLEGIRKEDFKNFLRLFFPVCVSLCAIARQMAHMLGYSGGANTPSPGSPRPAKTPGSRSCTSPRCGR